MASAVGELVEDTTGDGFTDVKVGTTMDGDDDGCSSGRNTSIVISDGSDASGRCARAGALSAEDTPALLDLPSTDLVDLDD